MKARIAILRNDNGVTWVSGPEDFDRDSGTILQRELWERFGCTVGPAKDGFPDPDKSYDALWLHTLKGEDVYFPLNKIQKAELHPVSRIAPYFHV